MTLSIGWNIKCKLAPIICLFWVNKMHKNCIFVVFNRNITCVSDACNSCSTKTGNLLVYNMPEKCIIEESNYKSNFN